MHFHVPFAEATLSPYKIHNKMRFDWITMVKISKFQPKINRPFLLKMVEISFDISKKSLFDWN